MHLVSFFNKEVAALAFGINFTFSVIPAYAGIFLKDK